MVIDIHLLVYDIANSKRLKEVSNICETFLTRVQKSVFEGDLTKSQLYRIEKEIKKVINEEEDSIFLYELPNTFKKKKKIYGKEIESPYILW